jgi:hypothetical protein
LLDLGYGQRQLSFIILDILDVKLTKHSDVYQLTAVASHTDVKEKGRILLIKMFMVKLLPVLID